MPSQLCPLPPVIASDARIPEPDALAAAPLLGLLAEQVMNRPTLDFANPRRAPDVGAARRQRVLVGVLALILVGGAGIVYATGQLAQLNKELVAEQNRRKELAGQFSQYQKDDARLRHIQTWRSAGVDWLGHATQISENMPDPHQAQLDQFGGRLAAEVSLTPKAGRYDPEGWGLAQAAGFSLAGHVNKREIADDLRLRLQKFYEKVETKGADVQDRFSFDLMTRNAAPEAAVAAPQEGDKPPAGASAPAKGAGRPRGAKKGGGK
jgi:hypothetical protein